MNTGNQTVRTVPEQIVRFETASQQQQSGRERQSVRVVLGGDTSVVTRQGALPPTEQALLQSPE
jgi:uncharacterized protein YbcI